MVSLWMGRSMGAGLSDGRVVQGTLASFVKMHYRARVFFFGAMDGRIRVSGCKVACMAKASLTGQMANILQASMRTTKSMGLESSHGQMAPTASASGTMGSNMVSARI